MKLRNVLLVVTIAIPLLVCAQSTTPQARPAGTETQTGSGSAQSTMQPGAMHHGHGAQAGDMHAMHEHEMAQMKEQIAKMRALLDQMKTNVAGMKGKDKDAMQANAELWQMMIDHMDQMMQHMSSMGMMGPGHMQPMGKSVPLVSPPPPPPPPQQ